MLKLNLDSFHISNNTNQETSYNSRITLHPSTRSSSLSFLVLDDPVILSKIITFSQSKDFQNLRQVSMRWKHLTDQLVNKLSLQMTINNNKQYTIKYINEYSNYYEFICRGDFKDVITEHMHCITIAWGSQSQTIKVINQNNLNSDSVKIFSDNFIITFTRKYILINMKLKMTFDKKSRSSLINSIGNEKETEDWNNSMYSYSRYCVLTSLFLEYNLSLDVLFNNKADLLTFLASNEPSKAFVPILENLEASAYPNNYRERIFTISNKLQSIYDRIEMVKQINTIPQNFINKNIFKRIKGIKSSVYKIFAPYIPPQFDSYNEQAMNQKIKLLFYYNEAITMFKEFSGSEVYLKITGFNKGSNEDMYRHFSYWILPVLVNGCLNNEEVACKNEYQIEDI